MTTEELHERLLGIQGCWGQALTQLEEVSGGLEAIIRHQAKMTLWRVDVEIKLYPTSHDCHFQLPAIFGHLFDGPISTSPRRWEGLSASAR